MKTHPKQAAIDWVSLLDEHQLNHLVSIIQLVKTDLATRISTYKPPVMTKHIREEFVKALAAMLVARGYFQTPPLLIAEGLLSIEWRQLLLPLDK